jgi:hypothetical protein
MDRLALRDDTGSTDRLRSLSARPYNTRQRRPPSLPSVERANFLANDKVTLTISSEPLRCEPAESWMAGKNEQRLGKSTSIRAKSYRTRTPPPRGGKEQLGETGYG